MTGRLLLGGKDKQMALLQQSIEEALERLCGERVTVHGAGRTDAGVHAVGQVAHIDLSKNWRTDRLRDALNAHLKPELIAILYTGSKLGF